MRLTIFRYTSIIIRINIFLFWPLFAHALLLARDSGIAIFVGPFTFLILFPWSSLLPWFYSVFFLVTFLIWGVRTFFTAYLLWCFILRFLRAFLLNMISILRNSAWIQYLDNTKIWWIWKLNAFIHKFRYIQKNFSTWSICSLINFLKGSRVFLSSPRSSSKSLRTPTKVVFLENTLMRALIWNWQKGKAETNMLSQSLSNCCQYCKQQHQAQASSFLALLC